MDDGSLRPPAPQTGRVDADEDPVLRLAPHAVVLRRSGADLQIGVEPSVVVPAAYDRLVRALRTGARRDGLSRTAHEQGLDPYAVPDLLAALAAARLLTPTPAAPLPPVRVVGAGELGSRTAHALVEAGFTTVYLADLPEPSPPAGSARRAAGTATGRTGPDRLDLLLATLAEAGPHVRVRRSRHFVQPEGDAVALTVVVADGPEPDRLVPDLLLDTAAPHLLVRCSGDEAVVGPLVVPRTTSCVRCADLARRDADPRWPSLLAQLTRLRIAPSPTLLAWASVTAAVQALAFVGGEGAETLGHTLELGAGQHTLRLRPWPVHPDCPCRWDAGMIAAGADRA